MAAVAKDKKTEFNLSQWVRQKLIKKMDINIDELKELAEADGVPQASIKKLNKQSIHLGRNNLRSRWGVKDLETLPRHANGYLIIDEMVKIYFMHKGDQPNELVKEHFIRDGLNVTDNVINKVRSEGDYSSPDPNQHKGARAGAPKVRKKSVKIQMQEDLSVAALFEVKRFVAKVGSIEAAEALLKQLKDLQMD